MTIEEHEAFCHLLNNDNIVIRPTDKGSGIVIMDKDAYIQSLQQEMEQSSSYEATEVGVTNESQKKKKKKVKKLVNRMVKDGAASKEMQHYLVPKYVQAGKLRGKPKIHKAIAPLRTVVSGIDTPTDKIAELAEHVLKEFVESTPSSEIVLVLY